MVWEAPAHWVGAPPSADVMRILVATDQHIGKWSKDPIRSRDALRSFRECLRLAKAQRADFLLLGGDLFDVNKPPRETRHAVLQLLRDNVLGPEPVALQLLSDPAADFPHSRFPRPNWEDPNLNIGLPILAINGNHDDTAGGELCALDELHEAGLINLFGKPTSTEEFHLRPLLLQKGATKLALYGLGAVKDEHLTKAFHLQKVTFHKPKETPDEWCNLFVLHQTRTDYARDSKSFINETCLPEFLHLTIWGHEHRAMVSPDLEPEEREPRKLRGKTGPDSDLRGYVMQPGSTVATSLDKAEAGKKFAVLVEVKGTQWRAFPIPLRTVRQFLVGEDIKMSELRAEVGLNSVGGSERANQEAMMAFCGRKVEELCAKADQSLNSLQRGWKDPKDRLPLIRIRVDFADCEPAFNLKEFGARFCGTKTANADLVMAYNSKKERRSQRGALNSEALADTIERERREQLRTVEDFASAYMQRCDDMGAEEGLCVLTPETVTIAARNFVADEESSLKDAEARLKLLLDKQECKIADLLSSQSQVKDLDEDLDEVKALELIGTLREMRIEADRRDRLPAEQRPPQTQGDELNYTRDQMNVTVAEAEEILASQAKAGKKASSAAAAKKSSTAASTASSTASSSAPRVSRGRTSTQKPNTTTANISDYFSNASAMDQEQMPPPSQAKARRVTKSRPSSSARDDDFADADEIVAAETQKAKRAKLAQKL